MINCAICEESVEGTLCVCVDIKKETLMHLDCLAIDYQKLINVLYFTQSFILNTPIQWEKRDDALIPYQSVLGNKRLMLRLNHFPTAGLYTLVVEDQDVMTLHDLPPTWKLPA